MSIYEFRLRFEVPKISDMTRFDAALMDCESLDDAFYGIDDNGLLEIEFDRESNSADQAIISAVDDVSTAINNARFLEAHPDMVGISDMAAYLSCSRQNMRKFSLKKGFPDPIHQGKSPIWHFCVVLHWLHENTKIRVADELLEISVAAQNANQEKRVKELSVIVDISNTGASAVVTKPEPIIENWRKLVGVASEEATSIEIFDKNVRAEPIVEAVH